MISPSPSLDVPIAHLSRFGKMFAKRLQKLEITTVRDLLFYFPFRYDDLSHITHIRDLAPELTTTVKGRIELLQNRRSPRKRMMLTEAVVNDDTGSIKVIWFNQPFLTKVLKPGDHVYLSGKVEEDQYGMALRGPSYEKAGDREPTHTARIVPVYSLTSFVTEKQFRTIVKVALPFARHIPDWIPVDVQHEHHLAPLSFALSEIHFPTNQKNLARATRRLQFDELFFIQLHALRVRRALTKHIAPHIRFFEDETKRFVVSLPFTLTNDQRKSAWEILQDLGKDHPMNRLLEGDVGAGKTVVAAIAALNTLFNGFSVALMAPTEILAEQHHATFLKLFDKQQFPIILRTSAKKGKIVEPALVIGTHALLQKTVPLKNLGLIIVDEQHRFGVGQRSALLRNANDTKSCESSERETDTIDTDIVEKELSYTLNGLFFEIQRENGRFARERQYADILEKKLQEHKIAYKRENAIVVGNRKSNFADFIIEDRILVELKAKPFLTKEDYMQTMRYLQAVNVRLGLLVNFRQEYLKPKRVLNSKFASFASDSHFSHRFIPHFLSMTATPIPRTLALTLYGDLDLSLLREMPKGRKNIETMIVEPEERFSAYEAIREEIAKGKQTFVICPLIDPSDALGVASATQEAERLQKEIFPDCSIGLLHGRMKSKEKERVMRDFVENKIHVLVSTAVVEVGVDVPNATVMMIEGAERFGLAQLHQFRGRVGRSHHQSRCFLFTESSGEKTRARLEAIVKSHDGFALAEEDLKLRGPGEIYGKRQSGLPDLKIASLTDQALIKEAREAAGHLLDRDPELEHTPLLKERIETWEKGIHLE